jgi:hypothetical protein
MENIVYKVKEFGNYLLSVCYNEEKKNVISVVLLNNNNYHNLNFVKLLRVQDDTEDKTVVELNFLNEEITVTKYSQIMEFINVFGVENTEEVKTKIKEYLDYFISVKDSIIL